MANRVNTMLKKILPQYTEPALRSISNVHVTYKHNEQSYLVKLAGYNSQHMDEMRRDSLDITTLANSNTMQVNISRDKFIKNVVDHIVTDSPDINPNPKNVVIDFSSPNIAKPFHVGHLRSTIIGNFIANINDHYNNKVTRINYLGDWGTQFGLLQYGLQVKQIDLSELKNNPIKTLYETYVYANKLAKCNEEIQEQARKYFSDIEQGRTSLDDWKKIREATIQELKIVYKRLGIRFDAYHWESDYNGTNIKDLMQLLESTNVVKTDDSGKKIAKAKGRDVTVLKSDNSTLYISRDIAALLDRYNKLNFDQMLYVVDNAQTDHFAALFDIVSRINNKVIEGCQHVKFGRIKGMSTRSGNVVFLNDILDEAKEKMYEKQINSKNTRDSALNDETCDILGTTAVIINDLKQRRQRDYTFNWDKALQTEGDSGIKLQYLHCRLWSLENNLGIALPDECNPNLIPEEIVGEVVAELSKFENILYRSLEEFEACIIVNYLFRLAKNVNRMINELKVRDASPDLAAQRLLIFHSARKVVKTSLEILGVKPLYEM